MDSPKINSMDDLTALLASQEKRILELEQANAALIGEVKKRFVSKEELPQAVAAAQPPYGVVSPGFLKRAFSVWGLHFIAQLIISLVVGLISFILFTTVLSKAVLPWLSMFGIH
jgi:polyferredoxin